MALSVLFQCCYKLYTLASFLEFHKWVEAVLQRNIWPMKSYLNSQHRNNYAINCSPCNDFIGFHSFESFLDFWKSITQNVLLQNKYSVYMWVHMFFYPLYPPALPPPLLMMIQPLEQTAKAAEAPFSLSCDWFLLIWFYSLTSFWCTYLLFGFGIRN